ncbi:unnamed protein product [Rotaria sp. Silwood2]|nr:unnamed protein product [Rotaria sp. Silwood2]CAF4040347.1 unnamed protein product [Rotaria sp. Silwood2]
MSHIKSFTNELSSSSYQSHYQISPDLILKVDDIFKDVNYRLFFDDNLNYEQLMFIIKNRNSIESHFIGFIKNYINKMIPDNNIRQVYLNNIDRFSRNMMIVNNDTNINYRSIFYDDSDDETLADDDSEDSNSSLDNSYDDLENVLLDEFDFEHFLNTWRCNTFNEDEEDNHN